MHSSQGRNYAAMRGRFQAERPAVEPAVALWTPRFSLVLAELELRGLPERGAAGAKSDDDSLSWR